MMLGLGCGLGHKKAAGCRLRGPLALSLLSLGCLLVQTACVPGSPTHTEWVEGGWSPKVHNRREISRPFLAQ